LVRRKRKIRKSTFLIIVTIALLAAVYYYLKIKPVDYTGLSQEIDLAVNDRLVELGVTSKDLTKIYREERKENNISWVAVTKEVEVPREVSMVSYQKSLTDCLKQIGADVYEAKLSDRGDLLSMKIGKHSLVMQSILLRYPRAKYRVAIVIDDLGQRKDLAKNFLRLNIPISFAILPQLPYSSLLAKELKNSGYETILHLPMEPEGYPETNPGPGALLLSMNSSQIESAILRNLKSVPGVSGASNHEGSRFTGSREKMVKALTVLQREGLFFFDSQTSPHSVAKDVAFELGMRVLSNDVFLDIEDEYGSISQQLEKLHHKVLESGTGIGIGHVTRKFTADVLGEYIRKFEEDDIEFVTLSELLK